MNKNTQCGQHDRHEETKNCTNGRRDALLSDGRGWLWACVLDVQGDVDLLAGFIGEEEDDVENDDDDNKEDDKEED